MKLLLEPIARSAPGADGVVDLYLVPAYDDVANLYFCDGSWQIRYPHAGELADSLFREGDTKTLSSASIREVLEAMKTHADQQA